MKHARAGTTTEHPALWGPRLLGSEAWRQVRQVKDCVQPPAAATAPQPPPGPASVQPHYGYFHLLHLRELDHAQAPFHLHFLHSWPSGILPHCLRRAAAALATGCARRVQAQVQLAMLVGVQVLPANRGLYGPLLTYLMAAKFSDGASPRRRPLSKCD